MTTITKERIELFIKNPLENGLTRGEQMELARIAMASLEAEPIGAFHIADQQVGGTSDYIKDGEWPIDNGVIDVYAVPPVQETGVYNDVFNIIGLLENNEWAEHCTSTVLGSLLESEITRLVGKEQPAPVVDADPVVFTDERNLHHIARGRETSLIWGKQNQEVGDIPLYRHAQPVPVDKEFIPKNLDKALGVVGVALPESKEEFNLQIERWIQRLIDRVIRYADEFKEQPVPVVSDDISGIIERFQYQADHQSEWHHIDEHSCKVNRRDLMTALEFMDSCRAAMLNGGKS